MDYLPQPKELNEPKERVFDYGPRTPDTLLHPTNSMSSTDPRDSTNPTSPTNRVDRAPRARSSATAARHEFAGSLSAGVPRCAAVGTP